MNDPAATPPDLDAEFLRSVPIEQASTIPSSWYNDPRFHEFDKNAVFAPAWQYVGPSSKLSAPGDWLTDVIAGNPVLVLSGEDGALRAFFNTCRHRGGPLAVRHGERCVIQCRYHGWTYRPDGSLRGVPKWDRVDLFDKGDYGLVPVGVAEWQGLVFVRIDEEEEAGTGSRLSDYLDGIVERIAPQRIAGKTFHSRVEYDVRCNWKVYVDNYLEGYHIPHVHPELCDLLDYQAYETALSRHHSLQHSPIDADENFYGDGAGTAFYYHVFPNFMMNILPGRLQTNLVVPVSHDACRVIFDYFYDDIESAEAKRTIDEDIRYADRVQAEDIEICEAVQLGLGSRAYDRGRYSVECETAVHHFHETLRTTYRSALAQTTDR